MTAMLDLVHSLPTRFRVLLVGTTVFLLTTIFFYRSDALSTLQRPEPHYAPPLASDLGSRITIHMEPGGLYRDAYPIQTIQHFMALAQSEVAARGLDTCKDKLGVKMVEAYTSSQLVYCSPSKSASASSATCYPVRGNEFTAWWPYPNSFCVSSGLQTTSQGNVHFQGNCDITREGAQLLESMGREKFLGTFLASGVDLRVDPDKEVNHTILLVGRQDQWNPFHVAEDMVTSVLALLIAGAANPSLAGQPIQIAFTDDYEIERNHFTSLWDRMGAWPPRRLSLDPFEPGTTLTSVVHSIGAGSSLLSSTGIGSPFICASTLVWAASHYYRHLFGLLPPASRPTSYDPINILWLSRAKMNAHEDKVHGLSDWQKERILRNEPAMIARIRSGLKGLCVRQRNCDFVNAEDDPTAWVLPGKEGERRQIRFASVDPFVHALESQIAYMGRATIVMSLHGGALGLSLFLPPGRGTILELQSVGTMANYHFHNMAHMMGHQYERIKIQQTLEVEAIWAKLESVVTGMMG